MAPVRLAVVALVLLVCGCGSGHVARRKPVGVMVISLDIGPSALMSMPQFVRVRHHDGRLLGNFPLTDPKRPLGLLVPPGSYRINVLAGCAGEIQVPESGGFGSGIYAVARI